MSGVTAATADLVARAHALQRAGRLADAEREFRAALAMDGAHFDALHGCAIVVAQLGRTADAIVLLERAVQASPQSAAARCNLGTLLNAQGRHAEALAQAEQALTLVPNLAEALNCRGGAQMGLGQYGAALESFARASALMPDDFGARYNGALALFRLARYAESLTSFDAILARWPASAEAHNNRGLCLQALNRHGDALASFERTLALRPNDIDAHYNRGCALRRLGRNGDALAAFDRALAVAPRFAKAHNNRGSTLVDMHRYDEARASFDTALAIEPHFAEALVNRGGLRMLEHRFAEAVADYDAAFAASLDGTSSPDGTREHAIDARLPFARGARMLARLRRNDWAGFEHERAALVDGTRAGTGSAIPLVMLAITDSPEDQLRCARAWTAARLPPANVRLWRGERYAHDRIRVAYLSSDLHDHPVSYLMAGVFEAHDRARFETIALSAGPDTDTPMRVRLKQAFERFIDVGRRGEPEIAALIRELEVDILVDLNGHTLGSRMGALALRPAPVQVSYLGFPGTTGAPYVDYVLADRCVVPEGMRDCFSEQVVYLPDTFQANDDIRTIAATPTRADLGLPEQGFVFCAFNNAYKIVPEMFALWMRVLRAVDGSVLWLIDGDGVVPNLRGEAARAGVDPTRLVFAPRLPYAQHLARYRVADLFLDTFPFTGGTTASDALWAGLPVVTRTGRAMAGRMATSLLRAMQLPELVTETGEAYEALATALARHPHELDPLRARLGAAREDARLFASGRFCRHLERAYETMFERAQRGEGPVSFAVEPIS